MSLREDFRNALGSIAAAVPDAVRTMRHGEMEQGAIVQSSSRDFAEAVSDTDPAEVARYVANAADFPTLEQGAAVEISGSGDSSPSFRVVVSMKTDPVGATFTVGLSAEFEKCPAAYTGTRRENGKARTIQHPLDLLVLENGTADNYTDTFAPTANRTWHVAISAAQWPEVTDPQIGDAIALDGANLRVASVMKRDGFWILTALARR